VHAQPCMQGSGDAFFLLCMLAAAYLYTSHDSIAASCTTCSVAAACNDAVTPMVTLEAPGNQQSQTMPANLPAVPAQSSFTMFVSHSSF
jgi:hypothetical protein